MMESEKVGLKLNIQKTKIMASSPITSWEIDGKTMETVRDFYSKSLQMVTAAMKLKDAPWKKSYDQPRQHIKKQRHYFANKGPSSQSYDFTCSVMSNSLQPYGLQLARLSCLSPTPRAYSNSCP